MQMRSAGSCCSAARLSAAFDRISTHLTQLFRSLPSAGRKLAALLQHGAELAKKTCVDVSGFREKPLA
jgi:hypothetical protein